MNIFYIHESPVVSAKAMSDKHVVKMILESAQLMSTAHHKLNSNIAIYLYKPTHVNHPSNVWVRESAEHYEWLYQHFLALCNEYTNRYHKVHATYTKLNKYLQTTPIALQRKGFTEPPCAMPDVYKVKSSLLSYRKYYESEKFFNEQDRTRYNTVLNTQGVL
jgi:two-component SAPR family response regulator